MRAHASPLRVALVGAGVWGQRYAEKLARAQGAELVAIVDRDLERAREAARHAGGGATASAEVTSIAPEIDAAVIAVPARAHAAVAVPLLAAGVAVLIEKPFAATLEEADALVALAERRGALLQAAHLERFNPAVEVLRRHVDQPRFIEANRLGPFPGRGTDVDVVLDLMIHDLDLLLELAPAPIERISARGVAVVSSEVDIANARIELAGGCVADITASRVSLKRERKMRIFQPNVYLSADFAGQTVQRVRRRDPPVEGEWPLVEAEGLPVEPRDALEAQVEAFLAAVRDGGPPRVGADAGRRALTAALQIAAEIRRWQ
jgi:predicted dehydrogenase